MAEGKLYRVHFSEKSVVIQAKYIPLEEALKDGETREELAPVEEGLGGKTVVVDYSDALYFEEVERSNAEVTKLDE